MLFTLKMQSGKENFITSEFREEELGEVIENFTEFLRGCGFYFEGELQIVDKRDALSTDTEKKHCDGNCKCSSKRPEDSLADIEKKLETPLPPDFFNIFDLYIDGFFEEPK